MLTPEERLEQLESVFEDLEDLSKRSPVIVEGKKDAEALALLGVTKNIITLSKGVSILAFCERIARTSSTAVILTDWDRKGGTLARMLRDGLMSNGVEVNENIRTQLAILSKKEIKDIEGIPRFVLRLRQLAGVERRRPPLPKLRQKDLVP